MSKIYIMLGHHITPDEEFWEGFLFDGEREQILSNGPLSSQVEIKKEQSECDCFPDIKVCMVGSKITFLLHLISSVILKHFRRDPLLRVTMAQSGSNTTCYKAA